MSNYKDNKWFAGLQSSKHNKTTRHQTGTYKQTTFILNCPFVMTETLGGCLLGFVGNTPQAARINQSTTELQCTF